MKRLDGTRVFVVEDEAVLLLELKDMLEELGCEVVGAAARLEVALKLAQELRFDVALLDINLDGKPIHPVAKVIAGRALPIIFTTGYGNKAAPMPGAVLEKPYDAASLHRKLSSVLRARE